MSGSYFGGGERKGLNQPPRGSRGGGGKVRGRGGFPRGETSENRFNAKQVVGKTSEDKMDNVLKLPSSVSSTAETSPAACSTLGVGKAPGTLQTSKKGKKRGKSKTVVEDGKEESVNDGTNVEALKHKSSDVKKSVASYLASKSASPSSNQFSPNQAKSPAVFASQDVRFKPKNSPRMPVLKVSKDPINVQSQGPEKSSSAFNSQNASVDKKVPERNRPTLLSKSTSRSTGLKVLSVTSSYPGYVFTANDRAKLVRSIPGVVIVNTALKGDSLILGVDIEHEKLSTIITQVEKDKSWSILLVDTTGRDAFAYFADWKLIPRVDKSGMFQLIVSLRGQGWRSRDEELKKRNQLLELVKDFNIAKVVHGEGETILLVGHVLECVAYSDCIRKVFTMERRHTWQPRPVTDQAPEEPSPGQERHFWVKVNCPEMSNLSAAHKQFTVHHELSTSGKVLQMEHQLFSAVDNYLVVFKDIGNIKSLGEQFNLLEIWPDSLPDIYTPTYGVDDLGFYSVSGRFPENLSADTRNRFAEDMKMIGAVGFRSGVDEDTFSLHFVNSRCLEQISRCAQFTSFRLTILSSLVRKPSLDKKLRKLVPTILKYKELKLAANSCPPELLKVESKMKKVNEVSVKDVIKVNVAVVKSTEMKLEDEATINEVVETKKAEVMIDCIQKSHQQSCVKKSISKQDMSSSVDKEDAKKSSVKKKGELKKVLLGDVAQPGQLNEDSLLKICFKDSGCLSKYLGNLSKFLNQIQDVVVIEAENYEVLFKFPSQKKVDEVLKSMSEEATNTIEKLKVAKGRVCMNVAKFFKNKFGIVLVKSVTLAKLKKEFGKFGEVEIEVRSRVFVLWFDSKLSFFKAMTDRRSAKHKPVPAAMNFKFSAVGVNTEPVLVATVKEVVDNKPPESVVLPKSFQLTEREIFGFIWQKQKGNKNIRDDQVISRQVTNFVKKVSCQELMVDEDGLVVTFANKSELTAALTQFCPPPVPDTEQLELLSRKFTLLPARGCYGLFSSKRVKPEDFDRFGDCKFKSSCIWFTDKLVMFQVLRDPVISKVYPALFIDCRNIFILSSKNLLAVAKPSTLEKQVAKPTVHEKPAASSALKTSSPCPGVVTRAASAKMSSDGKLPEEANQEKIPPSSTFPSMPTVPDDKAIVRAVRTPSLTTELKTLTSSCPLLETLLQPDQSAAGTSTSDLGVGRYGHIPSARMARTGYKQSKMPAMARDGAVADLFLEDKECYRNKNVTEAADLISNILHGQGSEVKGDTLREIKMKRVECFLKDRLGVEVEEEGKVGKFDGFTKLRKPIINVEKLREDVLKKNEDIDQRAEELSSFKKAIKTTLLKEKEAPNVVVEEHAPSAPAVNMHQVDDDAASAQDVLVPREMLGSMNEADDVGNFGVIVEDKKVGDKKPTIDEASELTPDMIGLFTLTVSVSSGSDPSLLSSLEDDISWFDTPVSIMCVENGSVFIEVKLRTKDMAMAVLGGLRHKYPGMEGDTTGSHADILPDKKTGLFTLCFTDTHKKRYKATLDMFKKYSKQPPVISRGLGLEQVLVGFHHKEEAVEAFRENLDSEEFPELHVAPVSRS